MPVQHLHETVDPLEQLPGETRLADAGDPGDREEPRPRSAPVARTSSLIERSSSWRPTNGGSIASPRPAPPRSPRTRSAPRLDRLVLALQREVADLLERDRAAGRGPWTRRRGRCRPRPSIGAEAVFTRSPATIPCEVAPTVAAASPVRTPARARSASTLVRGSRRLRAGRAPPGPRARRRPRWPTASPRPPSRRRR